MAQNPVVGVGAIFRKWNGTAWEAISQITNISGPSMSRETIDTTTLDSDGGYKKFIGSFRDGGDVGLTMNFTRDGYKSIKDDFESNCEKDYEIEIQDGSRDSAVCTTSIDASKNSTFQFKGLVTELPLTISVDDKVTMDVTIKVSGKVYLNDGANSGSPTYYED